MLSYLNETFMFGIIFVTLFCTCFFSFAISFSEFWLVDQFLLACFSVIIWKLYTYQFSCSVVSDSLWPHELQHIGPPCTSPIARVNPNSCLLSRWCRPTISSSVDPFSSCPQSFPTSGSFLMSQLFAWRGQSTGVSALASFPPRNPRADLLQNGLAGSPCSPRDSQESSPTPQFKSINSSALSFLHSPTLTSVHDHWKKHSFD